MSHGPENDSTTETKLWQTFLTLLRKIGRLLSLVVVFIMFITIVGVAAELCHCRRQNSHWKIQSFCVWQLSASRRLFGICNPLIITYVIHRFHLSSPYINWNLFPFLYKIPSTIFKQFSKFENYYDVPGTGLIKRTSLSPKSIIQTFLEIRHQCGHGQEIFSSLR